MYHLKNKRGQTLLKNTKVERLINHFIKVCIEKGMSAGERVTEVFDGNKFIIERSKRYVGMMYWYRSKTLKQDLLIVKMGRKTDVYDLNGKFLHTVR